jgi:predicted Zn-dependent protease
MEGVTRNTVELIKNGVAKNAVCDGATAIKAGTKPSGHSLRSTSGAIPMHLVFEGGRTSEDELIKSCERPTVYVTYFNYPSMPDAREAVFTATTRHGTFLIENGQFKQALPPLRFKEKTGEALSKVRDMTREIIIFGEENYGSFYPQSMAVPMVKIENCSFVGSNKYD